MMKWTKTLLALGFCTLSAVSMAKEKLTIGTEPGYAPFEYKLPSGQLTGFDVDVGNAICQKMDVDCEWKDQSFDSLIPALQARKFDLIHASITMTDARKKVIDFTTPLYAIPSQVIARKGSPIDGTLDTLKGKSIGVLQGSVQETYARKVWGKNGVKIVPYQDQNQTFVDLVSGRLDGALVEKPNATFGFLKKPEGKDFAYVGQPILHDPIMNNEISIGLRKGSDDLKNRMDTAIKALQADGTFEKLAKKYFDSGEISLIK